MNVWGSKSPTDTLHSGNIQGHNNLDITSESILLIQLQLVKGAQGVVTIFRIYINVYISIEENTHISKILYIDFSFTK